MSPHTATYVPDFELLIDGRSVGAELRAHTARVRFEEGLEGANRVEVELANVDLALIDHPQLKLGPDLRLLLGYRPGSLETVFRGTITGVEPTFPADGVPTIVLSAHDATQRLMSGTKKRGFPYYLTDSVIAAIIGLENNLISMPDPVAAAITGLGVFAERPRIQNARSDYDFLRQLASEHGFDLWVDGDILNFRRLLPRIPAPEFELRWGESLIRFAARSSSVGQVATIAVRVWVEAIKTQFQVEVGWDGERISSRVRPAFLAQQSSPVEATLSLPDVPLDHPVDAIRQAVAELRKRLNTRLTAQGQAVGDPRMRCGRSVSIRGCGNRLSGETYRLVSVVHTVDDGGYQTSFNARREVV